MAPGRSRGVAVKYRIALAFFATSCLAGVAVAADLPIGGPLYRGPFVARQPVEWTGIYFGANAGYGWGQHASNIIFTGSGTNGLTNPIPGPFPNFFTGVFPTIAGPTELSGTRVTGSADLNGAIAGGQIGFNWQAGMFVFGAELDGQWSGQQTTFTVNCGAGCTASETVKIRSLLTGRGRVGLAFDWIMPYVTGGAALINGIDYLTMTVAGTTASFQPLSGSTLGWTAGGGVELALWSNWSAKLEYLYVRANGATVNAPIPNALGTGTATTPMEYRDNIVRVGFNYRFGPRGGPGVLESPIVARDSFAWNTDFLPNLQFATDRASTQVAAASRARSPDHAPAKPVVAQDIAMPTAPTASDAAPVVRQAAPKQAAPRQVASAINEPQFSMADDDVIDTDVIVTEVKPARQVAKKRPEREEDESARMKRIMSICSGC
jgi:outer membrane immunogenic protein